MHQTDAPNNDSGSFTDGDPGGGIPATIIGSKWLNAVQEELLAILASAGISPNDASNVQVLAALVVLFGRKGSANTWAALQTFSLGLTSSVGPNTLGGTNTLTGTTTIAQEALITVGSGGSSYEPDWAGNSGNPAKFYKDSTGRVHLLGAAICSDNAMPSTILTLPAGYRPGGNRGFTCRWFDSNITTQKNLRVVVANNGTVGFGSENTVDGADVITLDGVSFLAEA